jgi:hypothetical protein
VITKYICELCGEEFTDFQQALDHEYHDKVHIGPDVYQVKPLRFLPKDVSCCSETDDPRPYPLDISVPMADGALVQYTFDRVITPAPSPEPEEALVVVRIEEQVQPEVTE